MRVFNVVRIGQRAIASATRKHWVTFLCLLPAMLFIVTVVSLHVDGEYPTIGYTKFSPSGLQVTTLSGSARDSRIAAGDIIQFGEMDINSRIQFLVGAAAGSTIN